MDTLGRFTSDLWAILASEGMGSRLQSTERKRRLTDKSTGSKTGLKNKDAQSHSQKSKDAENLLPADLTHTKS